MNTRSVQRLIDSSVMGVLAWSDVPALASEALDDGLDSPTLRVLAGLVLPSEADIAPLLGALVEELKLDIPDISTALERLAVDTAYEIVSGKISPITGARTIWNFTRRVEGPTPLLLHTFVYAASEWDDRPDSQIRFGEGVAAAARELVEQSRRGCDL